MTAYTINHFDQTIILTKHFAKEAGTINSAAYTTLLQLRRDYPEYTVAQRTAERKGDKANSNRNLTYDNMRKHIVNLYGEASKEEKAFEAIVAASKLQAGPYAYVKTWFLKQYPDVRPADDKNNTDK